MSTYPAPSQCTPSELVSYLETMLNLAFEHFARGKRIWISQEFEDLTISTRFRSHLGGRGNSLELLLAPAGLRVSRSDLSAIQKVINLSIIREETLPLNRKAQALYFLCDRYALQNSFELIPTGSAQGAN